MKQINIIAIFFICLAFFSSCKKTYIEQKDFEWIVELNNSHDNPQYIMDTTKNSILLFGENDSVVISLDGKKVNQPFLYSTKKKTSKIYFYAQTFGIPMISKGRRSEIALIDTTEFDKVYFMDEIDIAFDLEHHRNNDKKMKYLLFFPKNEDVGIKLEFNKYDMRDVYDIIQIDQSRFAVTFENNISHFDNSNCIGLLNLNDLF